MRVAYLVQSHRSGAEMSRLLATLRRGSPEAILVVARDPAAPPLPEAMLAPHGALVFQPSCAVRRGYWSALAPYLEAVERLAARAESWDWLVYLSGQDYPVRPLAAIEADLAASPYDGYLELRDAAAPSGEGRRHQGELRYGYRYRDAAALAAVLPLLRWTNGLQRLWHLHLTYGPRIGLRLPAAVRDAHRVRSGSQWTTLRRRCAERLAEAGRATSPWRQRFERTVVPDEAFAQTVLAEDGHFRLCGESRRFFDFTGSRDGRPRILRLADAAAMTTGRYDFARKFDAVIDGAILGWLDEHLAASR